MFTKKQIWSLLIPLMAEQVLTAMMGSVDTMMVSNAGSAAISAVSLVDAINVLIIQVFSAMATGGTIVCAQYLGAQKKDEANRAGGQLVMTVLVLSVAIAGIFVALRWPMLNLIFGTIEQAVMADAEIYFFITALSYPFIALYNAGAALFRVDGHSRLPLIVSTGCNLVNIVGNALLIFGMNMGVAGAALATLVSRALSAVIILLFLRKPRQTIVVRNYRAIRPDFPMIRRILAVGIPTGVENGMFQFGKLAIQSTVSTMGTVAIAAQAMTATLEGFSSYASIGIGLGMMTIVGQCIGAGRIDEARRYTKKLSLYGGLGILASCIAVAALIRPITIMGGMEPEAAEMTIQLTWLICIVKPFLWTLSFMPAYGMRAAGDVRFSMLVATATMWLCRVLVTILLVRLFSMGPLAVWLGMFSDWFVRSVIFSVRFRGDKWIHRRMTDAHAPEETPA